MSAGDLLRDVTEIAQRIDGVQGLLLWQQPLITGPVFALGFVAYLAASFTTWTVLGLATLAVQVVLFAVPVLRFVGVRVRAPPAVDQPLLKLYAAGVPPLAGVLASANVALSWAHTGFSLVCFVGLCCLALLAASVSDADLLLVAWAAAFSVPAVWDSFRPFNPKPKAE